MRHITLIIAVVALALAAPAFSGKGGNPNGGNNAGGGAGSGGSGGGSYTGSLTATPNVLRAGDYFDVSGCGYDMGLGNVVVSFLGAASGSPLGPGGCFSGVTLPAMNGDTLAPGTYEVRALQFVRNKWTETGETTITVQ